MWAPLKEVAHFAIFMGALVAIVSIMDVASWLVKKIDEYFDKED